MNKWEWLLSFVLMLSFTGLTALYFQQFKPYQLGLISLKDENYSEARKEFLHMLEQKPFLFSARLNLALIESLQKNIQGALGEYKVVIEDSPDKEERFQAYFNSAILKFQLGDIPSSLQHYQQALKENPESIETKVNIEWMMLIQDQQNKQKQQEQEKENKQDENQDSQDGSEQSQQEMKTEEKGEEKKEEKTEEQLMNEDQAQFIFKELEEREKKLRSRLQNKKGKRRKGKSW